MKDLSILIAVVTAMIFMGITCNAQPPTDLPAPDDGIHVHIDGPDNHQNYCCGDNCPPGSVCNQPNPNQNYCCGDNCPPGSVCNQPNPNNNDAPPASMPPSFTPEVSSDTSDTLASSLPEGTVTKQAFLASGIQPLMVVPYSLQNWVYYHRQWSTGPAGIYFGNKMSSVIYNPVNQNLFFYEKYWNSGRVNYRNWGTRYGDTYVHAIFIADEQGWHELAVKGSQTGWSNVIWMYVY